MKKRQKSLPHAKPSRTLTFPFPKSLPFPTPSSTLPPAVSSPSRLLSHAKSLPFRFEHRCYRFSSNAGRLLSQAKSVLSRFKCRPSPCFFFFMSNRNGHVHSLGPPAVPLLFQSEAPNLHLEPRHARTCNVFLKYCFWFCCIVKT
ncbi:hypothetical protein IC582_024545 [Cucumis melo]